LKMGLRPNSITLYPPLIRGDAAEAARGIFERSYKQMKAIIDRFEGEFAVFTPVGGGKPFNIAKAALPGDAVAGTTVELARGSWTVCKGETEARRKSIADKARRIFDK
jgi:hypothetical protein